MSFSGWEAVFFWIFSIAALVAGLLTIMARNAVHSALFLISSLVSIAALFILLGAEFIAGVQILVYVGGVMVLFLFVIMLVNVGAEERGRERIFNHPKQVVASIFFLLPLAFILVYALNQGYKGLEARNVPNSDIREQHEQQRAAEQQNLPDAATGTFKITQDTERVGRSLYSYASLPFEIASVLLLVAIIGSVMLARTIKQEAAADDVDPEVFEKQNSEFRIQNPE
ncbi:MAG: NADH-quinone oxidoreductase subunit [Acidobacteriota bacterium]|jgi:NADH-quinone oxidoreductase subunit J|nr:NADH-quinone oxidoreductase subunit [Acidobacteriota bacterium]